MKRATSLVNAGCGLLLVVGLTGCSNKVMDPAQIGRFRAAPAVNVILDSLGVAQESPMAYDHAQEPRPSDLVAEKQDMVLGSGDVVRVTVYELYAAGQWVSNEYVVSETGSISVPGVGVLQVAGVTEKQLEQVIREHLEPAVLKSPKVSVSVVNSQRRRFSIVGDGLTAPGSHPIPRFDFRLTDALALAGGARQLGVSYIYVSRHENGSNYGRMAPTPPVLMPPASQPSRQNWSKWMQESSGSLPLGGGPPAGKVSSSADRERAMLGMVNAHSQRPWDQQPSEVIAATQFPSYPSYDQVVSPSEYDQLQQQLDKGEPVPSTGSPLGQGPYGTSALQQDAPQNVDWVFKDGRWIPVPKGAPTTTPNGLTQPQGQPGGYTAPNGMQMMTPPNQQPQPYVPQGQPLNQSQPFGQAQGTQGTAAGTEPDVDWILENGQWVPVPRRQAQTQTQPQEPRQGTIPMEPVEPTVQGQQWQEVSTTRLIRIPTDQLLAGNSRYNIVIKPGDTIYVPYDQMGFFYIMGNVNRTGKVNLTGEPITLMGAIATAGGLGPLAWPKNVEVRRRLDRNREEIVLVDLDKIASGEQPDFYIKPNDVINVGTHYTSRWRAVLRNAFRAAYGFGFVYDRNFADSSYDNAWPHWF